MCAHKLVKISALNCSLTSGNQYPEKGRKAALLLRGLSAL